MDTLGGFVFVYVVRLQSNNVQCVFGPMSILVSHNNGFALVTMAQISV